MTAHLRLGLALPLLAAGARVSAHAFAQPTGGGAGAHQPRPARSLGARLSPAHRLQWAQALPAPNTGSRADGNRKKRGSRRSLPQALGPPQPAH